MHHGGPIGTGGAAAIIRASSVNATAVSRIHSAGASGQLRATSSPVVFRSVDLVDMVTPLQPSIRLGREYSNPF